MSRAIKQVEVDYLRLLESNSKQAYAVGKFYLATGDENYVYTLTDQPKDDLASDVQHFVATHLRASLMQKGAVEPLAEQEKKYWLELQEISDQEDERILSGRTREEAVEEGCFVKEIHVRPPKPFTYPRAKVFELDNGLKVLAHESDYLPKIDIIIDFVADHLFDPKGKEGLSAFVASLLLEGTKNYPGHTFADEAESYGMSITSAPGAISVSMLAQDLEKALEFLNEMLMHATLTPEAIERGRARMLAGLKEYWDTPMQFSGQLVRQEIYKDHPYSKNPRGTIEGVQAITRDDILSYYKKYLSPRGTRMAIVGDTGTYDIKKELSEGLKEWQGEEIKELSLPAISDVKWHEINHPILRDQTVLYYGALSVDRSDSDYDKLLLFDQIFTGGVLSSMASRLFDLREQSGLFYTIGGSLLSHVDKDKGLILIRTIVSNDRLKEAEVAIERVINTAIDQVSDEEFTEAQQAICNSLVNGFAANQHIAATLLALDKFGLPADYFDTRAEQLSKISKQEMQDVVKKYLTTDRFVLIRSGRGQNA